MKYKNSSYWTSHPLLHPLLIIQNNRKIYYITNFCYSFLFVNELFISIFVNYFCKNNLRKYCQIIHSRATATSNTAPNGRYYR